MRIKTARILAAATAIAAGVWASAEQTVEQLQDKVQSLETKVAAMEARQAGNGKDLAAAIDSIVRDSEKRSQLLATRGETSAGYDGGFFIKAGDAFSLKPGAQFQFRNSTNYRESDSGDSWENGFELRRMKFELAGNAFSKDLDYFFNWQTERNSGDLKLEEAWARYFFADDWGMKVGQFKDLASHEFLMSSKRLLAADVSMVDQAIGGSVGGYTQGVTLIYGGARNNNNPLNIEAGYTDGANQLNTDFTGRGSPLPDPEVAVSNYKAPGSHAFDWGIAGRVEYKVMGDWKSYRDFTAKGTKQDLLVFGAGGDWSQGGDGDLIIATGDAQYEHPSGLGLYGAVLYRRLESEISGMSDSLADWGGLVQGSYAFAGNWEVFARYDVLFADEGVSAADGEDTFHEVTLGVNYYFGKDGSALHRAKLTVDFTWLPNGAPASLTGLDILDKNNGENEFILRAQFQLLI